MKLKEEWRLNTQASNKAYFGWIKFETPLTSIGKIEEEIKNNDNI